MRASSPESPASPFPPAGVSRYARGMSFKYVAAGGAVASAAIVVNVVVGMWLRPGARDDINVRGAYLEVLGDLLGSFAVIAAGGLGSLLAGSYPALAAG